MKIEAFGSKRDQHNAVMTLSKGNQNITLPRERLIKQALNELSKDSSRDNVSFLLDTAENNKYGSASGSGLSKYMAEHSTLSELYKSGKPSQPHDFSWMAVSKTPRKRPQNTDWDSEIQNAVYNAMSNMPQSQRKKFLKRYDDIFVNQKSLTDSEKKLISLRETILSSEVFKKAEKKGSKKAISSAMKNLDFFIVSSETPIKDRIYVLSRLAHFLSNDYKINPQLKDKKLQAFSEMINDIVVRTPLDSHMKIKKVDQKYHGSCAAISLARKTLAYSDKCAYVDMVMSEIDDKPYMEIYDVTRLISSQSKNKKGEEKRAPKVKVEKVHVNYDRAAKEGYRIVDASVLNWMKIAGTVGDGRINLEDYFAFDARHNGMMHDSRIINSGDESYAQIHDLLRVYIKMNELFEAYDQSQVKSKIRKAQYAKDGLALGRKKDIEKAKVKAQVSELIKSDNSNYVLSIVNYISDSKKVNTNNSVAALGKQLETQLGAAVKNLKAEEAKKGADKAKAVNSINLPQGKDLKEAALKLADVLKTYKSAENEYNALTDSRAEKISNARRLFNIGVAQREVYRQAAEVSENVGSMYEFLGLPNRPTQIQNRIKRLKKLAQDKPSSPIIQDIRKKNNLKNNQNVTKMLSDLEKELDVTLPKKMDAMLAMFGKSYAGIACEYLALQLANIENGDSSYIADLAERKQRPINTKKFKKQLQADIEALSQPMSCDKVSQIMYKYEPDNYYEKISSILNDMIGQVIDQYEKYGYDEAKTAFEEEYRPSSEEELQQTLSKLSDVADFGQTRVEEIADQINYPSESEVVLKAYEKKGLVQSADAIKSLSEKLDLTREILGQDDNKKIPHRSQQLTFTPEQRKTLASIEKSIPKTKHNVSRSYKIINDVLSQQLEDLYCDVGKRKGHFWTREETSSGLYGSEQVRLIEQMTGRPYHQECDIDDAVAEIKKGTNAASSSSMVCYDEPSGHAQYIADVKTVSYVDSKTGKKVEADVLLHDNSWGDSEGKVKNSYIDENSLLRVNYGKNYGGPNGFYAESTGLTGNFVSNFKYDNSEYTSYFFPKAINGPQTEVSHTIPIPVLYSVILEGQDPRIFNKTAKIMKQLVSIANASIRVNNIFDLYKQLVDNGSVNMKSDLDKLDNIEKGANNFQKSIENRMETPDGHKLTIEDYNKLPKDDVLRLIIEKVIVTKAFGLVGAEKIKEELEDIKTVDALETYKAEHLQEIKKDIEELLIKDPALNIACGEEVLKENLLNKDFIDKYSLDAEKLEKDMLEPYNKIMSEDQSGSGKKCIENFVKATKVLFDTDEQLKTLSDKDKAAIKKDLTNKMKSQIYVDNIKDFENEAHSKNFIAFIDNVLKPRDDKDFVRQVNRLIDMSREEVMPMIEKAGYEDMGIKFDTPKNIIKLYHASNDLTIDRFNDMVRYQYFLQPNIEELFEYPQNAQAELSKDTEDLDAMSEVSNLHQAAIINNDVANIPKNAGIKVFLPAFNTVYRNAVVDLSSLSIEKVLKQHKHAIFDKYKVRPSLPIIHAASDEVITEHIEDDLKTLNDALFELKSNRLTSKYLIVINEANDALLSYETNKDSDALLAYLDKLHAGVVTLDEFSPFENDVLEAKELVKNQASAKDVAKAIHSLIITSRNTLKGEDVNSIKKGEEKILEKVANAKYMVEANILPGQQSFVRSVLNKYIKQYMKNVDEETMKENEEFLIENMKKNHLVTDVEKFLRYALELSVDKNIPQTEREKITQRHKALLTQIFQNANRANVEFRLMEMAEKGYASKVRDLFDIGLFGLDFSNTSSAKRVDNDGQETEDKESVQSARGMQFLIDTLGNKENNHSTLMLFMEQTGMVDRMLDSLYKRPLRQYKSSVDKTVSVINSLIAGNVVMRKHLKGFLDTIPEDTVCKDITQLKELNEKLISTLNQSPFDAKRLAIYKQIFVQNLETMPSELTLYGTPNLKNVYRILTSNLIRDIYNNTVSLASDLDNYLNETVLSDITLLENVRLAPGSEEDIKRQETIEKMVRIVNYAKGEAFKISQKLMQEANTDI